MRLLACLVFVACNSKQPVQQTPAKEPAPRKANDPWAGSAEPVWAKDPPDVLRSKINGVNAHIFVLKSSTFSEWRDVLATVEKIPAWRTLKRSRSRSSRSRRRAARHSSCR